MASTFSITSLCKVHLFIIGLYLNNLIVTNVFGTPASFSLCTSPHSHSSNISVDIKPCDGLARCIIQAGTKINLTLIFTPDSDSNKELQRDIYLKFERLYGQFGYTTSYQKSQPVNLITTYLTDGQSVKAKGITKGETLIHTDEFAISKRMPKGNLDAIVILKEKAYSPILSRGSNTAKTFLCLVIPAKVT